MREINNNETSVFVAEEEYARWRQRFNREQELISRMMAIPEEASRRIEQINLNRNWFNVGDTLLDNSNNEYVVINNNSVVPRERVGENIPCWNGKVLEKVEVFK